MRLATGLPCIDVAAERTRHSVATIPIPLAPCTDHLLDIERAPGARVYRRGFTTSAYGTLAGFAAALLGTRPIHRYAPDGAMAAVAAAVSDAPAGGELDDAFDACGDRAPPHAAGAAGAGPLGGHGAHRGDRRRHRAAVARARARDARRARRHRHRALGARAGDVDRARGHGRARSPA